jgi:hypothetical protein
MPSTVIRHIASITEGFSFAYLKETYVASLLTLAWESAESTLPAEDEDVRKWGRLGNLLRKQVALLRHEMSKADKSEAQNEKVDKGGTFLAPVHSAIGVLAKPTEESS